MTQQRRTAPRLLCTRNSYHVHLTLPVAPSQPGATDGTAASGASTPAAQSPQRPGWRVGLPELNDTVSLQFSAARYLTAKITAVVAATLSMAAHLENVTVAECDHVCSIVQCFHAPMAGEHAIDCICRGGWGPPNRWGPAQIPKAGRWMMAHPPGAKVWPTAAS